MRPRFVIGLLGAYFTAVAASLAGCGAADKTESQDGGGGVAMGGAGGVSASGGNGADGGGDDCQDEEVCDGIDNNCDEQVDEGCACFEGQTQECYSGPTELLGIGDCQYGEQLCDITGVWGDCVGEGLPTEEICDSSDNDCNGEVDDGFDTITCGIGVCQVTVDECVDGVPNPCIPGTPAPTETCDGTDDDCDGAVDEGCSCVNGTTQSCYTGSPTTQGVGECSDGLQTCANGAWGPCVGDTVPSSELCDGLDNDCDTETDENIPGGGGNSTTTEVGVCEAGHYECVATMLTCVQDLQPSADLCDGLDNDCDPNTPDGSGDPGIGIPCDGPDSDLCELGMTYCDQGMPKCDDDATSLVDLCDGLDNDCDVASPDGSEDPGVNVPWEGRDSEL